MTGELFVGALLLLMVGSMSWDKRRRKDTPGEPSPAPPKKASPVYLALPYNAYTTEFDQIVHAKDWCKQEEADELLEKLRAKLDCLPDIDLGLQQVEEQLRNAAITILLDNSGSLRGDPIEAIAAHVGRFAGAVERVGGHVEILGFTTSLWCGGRSRELWIQNGRPLLPGRLNDLLHIVYKTAEEPMADSWTNLALMLREDFLKENIDGEAIVWAAQRLALRSEASRSLFVVSDGAPVDDSTLHENGDSYLMNHLRSAVKQVESMANIDLVGICVHDEFDASDLYSRSDSSVSEDKLEEVMAMQLLSLMDAGQQGQSEYSAS